MQDICEDILTNYDTNVQIPEFLIHVQDAFENTVVFRSLYRWWYFTGKSYWRTRKPKKRLVCGEHFYRIFLKFISESRNANSLISLDKHYSKFFKMYKSVDQTKSFEDFYECANVRYYSEAVCETIGSIMGQWMQSDATELK